MKQRELIDVASSLTRPFTPSAECISGTVAAALVTSESHIFTGVCVHRFLLHTLNHTMLCVDISSIGLPTGIIGDSGEAKNVPSIRFRTWSNVQQHFLALGAEPESLRTAIDLLKKTDLGVLTITKELRACALARVYGPAH